MTGMGNFLATVVLAVPLMAWLRGTFLFGTPPCRLARIPSAPCEKYPNSQKSYSPGAPNLAGADEVTR